MERRDAKRVSVSEPLAGGLRILHDVSIGPFFAGEVTVVTAASVPRGEHMRLEIPRDLEPPTSLIVRSVESGAALDSGRMYQSVRLQIIRGTHQPLSGANGAPISIPTPSRQKNQSVLGALIRRIPVRLISFSRTGLLLEAPVSVEQGTVGFVEIAMRGRRHEEAIRVRRLERRDGRPWPIRIAGEFLTLRASDATSLRGVASVFSAAATVTEDRAGERV